MGKVKRGGYIFLVWIGDHSPKHVHVYKNGNLIVKWDLENNIAMKGSATRTILKHIEALLQEGKI